MSDDGHEKLIQEQFVQMASAHIDLANQQVKTSRYDLVALAINHAAARYAAFSISQFRPDDLVKDRDAIIESLVQQYRDMLNEHYDAFASDVAKG